ncbi:MAG: response regulator [Candidatus Caldatribacteriota bacterium]|nr:response regulator [Candidatus Caldatribacteriota bacterium]
MDNKISILIVDDDKGMTETLSDILTDLGYDVAVSGDGHQAIEMIKEKKFDFALMDIKMPGINGVETFKEVHRISPETKVIMMTAYSVEELVKEALQDGAFDILYKPLDIKKILTIIKKTKKGSLVLIVDDDHNTCETLKDILKKKNYKIAVAYNGEEAIDLAEKNEIDIALIDIKLPLLNGLETYLRIKKINPKITAIIITGYRQTTGELVKESLSNSAYTCLYKPLDMDKLLTMLNDVKRGEEKGDLKKPKMEE